MSIFSKVAGSKTPRSKFNLGHEKKLSLGLGDLIPTFVQETLPGDRFKVNQEIMIRMAPMIAPIMHRIDVWTHYFFVPNRIIWDSWEAFITGGEEGLDAPVHPFVTMDATNYNRFQEGKLSDFLGLPTTSQTAVAVKQVNALPFRAYHEIWNEYYRDQNVDQAFDYGKGDGASDTWTPFFSIKQRNWHKDYFGSALPWTQRGPESEIGGRMAYKPIATVIDQNGDPTSLAGALEHDATTGDLSSNTYSGLGIDNIESLGITINELRQSTRLQEWLERQARGGSRLTETILSHFGVRSKDSRLQRPEYLGGSKNPLSVSEVLNTTGIIDDETGTASGGDVQGAMAGHGVAVGSNKGFNRTFDEHGWVLGLTSVMPKRNYQQGIDRSMMRKDKFDYYWPEFANLGEQAIENSEIYFDPSDGAGANEQTFGYTPRYSEYKYQKNTVHGAFRSSLNHWHLGEIWSARPNLSLDFQRCRPSDRIFAVNEGSRDYTRAGEELYCQVINHVDAVRPMPYYGTPRL